MKHIRGKHIVVGVLESTAGGLIVASILQHIWWLSIASVLVAGSAITLDRFNIEEEEHK